MSKAENGKYECWVLPDKWDDNDNDNTWKCTCIITTDAPSDWNLKSPIINGTTVTFKPDPTIFDTTIYDYDTLMIRTRELAFLNKGIKLTIEDKRKEDSKKEEYHYEGGISEYVAYLNRNKKKLHNDVIVVEEEVEIDPPPQSQVQEDIPFLLTIGSMITMLSSSIMNGYTTIYGYLPRRYCLE